MQAFAGTVDRSYARLACDEYERAVERRVSELPAESRDEYVFAVGDDGATPLEICVERVPRACVHRNEPALTKFRLPYHEAVSRHISEQR